MSIAQEFHSGSYHEATLNPEFLTAEFNVRPDVCAEVAGLSIEGRDVALVDPIDPHALNKEDQDWVDAASVELQNRPDGAELFRNPPAMKSWAPLTKRAIALHPLYNAASVSTLGEGIEANAYD